MADTARNTSASPFALSLLAAPVETFANHVLGQFSWARQRLQPFAGKSVRVAMAPFAFTFAIRSDGTVQRSEAVADLDVVLPADTPLRAIEGSQSAMKAAAISGPADLADALGYVLLHLRWDIEADLSRVFGDIAARRVTQGLAALADWQTQATRNLAENFAEYLALETAPLVASEEMQRFAEEVKTFSERLERSERRLG